MRRRTVEQVYPRKGDVYRVENIFPTVFEEIEITEVEQTVEGPLGPVAGAFTVQQLHLGGSYAPKVFAPGYGEFSTGDGTVEALALAIPADASPRPAPAELRALLGGSRQVFHAVGAGNWTKASSAVGAMNTAWARYRTSGIPRLLKPLLTEYVFGPAEQQAGGLRPPGRYRTPNTSTRPIRSPSNIRSATA